jgi:hypothetical protein
MREQNPKRRFSVLSLTLSAKATSKPLKGLVVTAAFNPAVKRLV